MPKQCIQLQLCVPDGRRICIDLLVYIHLWVDYIPLNIGIKVKWEIFKRKAENQWTTSGSKCVPNDNFTLSVVCKLLVWCHWATDPSTKPIEQEVSCGIGGQAAPWCIGVSLQRRERASARKGDIKSRSICLWFWVHKHGSENWTRWTLQQTWMILKR